LFKIISYYLLEQNQHKIWWISSWSQLLLNLNIFQSQKININWNDISLNSSAIQLLEQNPDKINWYNLSANPNAIHLLFKNQNKINWQQLSKNPSIFE